MCPGVKLDTYGQQLNCDYMCGGCPSSYCSPWQLAQFLDFWEPFSYSNFNISFVVGKAPLAKHPLTLKGVWAASLHFHLPLQPTSSS